MSENLMAVNVERLLGIAALATFIFAIAYWWAI